jgi:starch phosphorylase
VREIVDFTLWKSVDNIPDLELWNARQDRREKLVKFVREKLQKQLERRGASASEINRVQDVLNPDVLTIGFARRFAPYKRGDLIFRDVERVARLISDEHKPIQIIFAGKSHPADEIGKSIIKRIFKVATRPDLYKRVVFLEDYDMDIARNMVQGVDIWLNTPRRPLEASGTSGMKAAINGALNLSVLDGWWDEAFNSQNGWGIGHGEHYDDWNRQDEIEANLLYRLLENEVIPTFYDRDRKNVPTNFVKMIKNTIRTCGDGFNAQRMLLDYNRDYYLKSEKLFHTLADKNYQGAKDLAAWRQNLENHWDEIQVLNVECSNQEAVYTGGEVTIRAKLQLADINPDTLHVEVYYGPADVESYIHDPLRIRMQQEHREGNIVAFVAHIPCNRGGRYSYVVRVLPGHPNLAQEFIPKLIKWEGK